MPVPLDMVFTYRVSSDAAPVVGGRVLVPFRQQRLTGIVVELHDRVPSVAIKPVLRVLDATPVLDEQLLTLGRWIANYYLAPLGEVFRSMLPLNAEFKRAIAYRITPQGQLALYQAGASGSSARARRTPEEQAAEFRILDYLASQESVPGEAIQVREESLRSATRSSLSVLAGMVRKKWLAREDVSAVRDATRTVKFAILKSAEGKLNENQRRIIDTLASLGSRALVEELQAMEVPRTTLRLRFRAAPRERRDSNLNLIQHSKLPLIACDLPSSSESSRGCYCTALRAREKLRSIWRG
jgi:primosomal protein N' (replication factor Y)